MIAWLAKSMILMHLLKSMPNYVVVKSVHLCLDKGYDYKDTEAKILNAEMLIPHIRRRGEPPLLGIIVKGRLRQLGCREIQIVWHPSRLLFSLLHQMGNEVCSQNLSWNLVHICLCMFIIYIYNAYPEYKWVLGRALSPPTPLVNFYSQESKNYLLHDLVVLSDPVNL